MISDEKVVFSFVAETVVTSEMCINIMLMPLKDNYTANLQSYNYHYFIPGIFGDNTCITEVPQ